MLKKQPTSHTELRELPPRRGAWESTSEWLGRQGAMGEDLLAVRVFVVTAAPTCDPLASASRLLGSYQECATVSRKELPSSP